MFLRRFIVGSPSVYRKHKNIKRSFTKSPLASRCSDTFSPCRKRGKMRRTLFSPGERTFTNSPLASKCSTIFNPSPKKRNISSRRTLFNVADTSSIRSEIKEKSSSEELVELAPRVMEELSRSELGLDKIMVKFFRMVASNKFPLTNISYLLWCEVVKWYQNDTTTKMRYSDTTKTFWKLGWRLFGGRFVYFMTGYKNQGEVLEKHKHMFRPESSEINFAVPDMRILRSFDPYKVNGERYPGIFDDIITNLSDSLLEKSSCLTYDGKKIKQGLTETSGDVDLLGFEMNETLESKKAKLEQQKDEIDNMIEKLSPYQDSVKCIPSSLKQDIERLLLKIFKTLSKNIFEIRTIREKKEYCKSKLIEKGGQTDWKKGKYVYAISAVIALIYDIDNYLTLAKDMTRRIVNCLAECKESKTIQGDQINLSTCSKYHSLDCIPPEKTKEDTRYVHQKSDEWFKLRGAAKVTGSTVFAAVGCDGLCRAKDHFDKVICGVKQKEPTEFVKRAMQHGTENEINGVATAVGVVIPALYPHLQFYEEVCVVVKLENGSPFMVVSPDGSLRENDSLESTKVAIEIKCPVNKIHTHFPPRYLLQCLSEIESLGVDRCLYLSWTKEETAVFLVHKDSGLFSDALGIALDIYHGEHIKKPTKLNDKQKELLKNVTQKSKEVELVGIFSSVISGKGPNVFSEGCLTVSGLTSLLKDMIGLINTHYELRRERASEAMVFLVADLDRSWEKEKLRCATVSWFPRGYSLSTENYKRWQIRKPDIHFENIDISLNLNSITMKPHSLCDKNHSIKGVLQ